MPFESRHTRFGFPTDKWSPVPRGKAVAHEPSISTSRLRTHIPGVFSVKVDTEVTSDQSQLTVLSENLVRTSLFSFERFKKNVKLHEQFGKKITVKTGTLGRRMQFRSTK